ncbi:MAG: glycosyltransferase family 4 protein [Isosphaeraceae bacterium]
MSKSSREPYSESEAFAFQSHPSRRVLFASAHSIVDFSNGAAVASLDVLRALASAGFACQAFCASRLDFHEDTSLEKIIVGSGEPLKVRPSVCPSGHARLLCTRRGPVPITIVRLQSSRQNPEQIDEARVALDFFATFLQDVRPDVLLTYGGDPITQGMIALARAHGTAVVFALHNFAYTGLAAFRGVDYCIAPSEFACRYYRERLGLICQPLPNPVDGDRVTVPDREPRFVTFVNPLPEKGVYPFVAIAHELARRRPDIPLLVVESRGTRKNLVECGLGKDVKVNVQINTNTPDPRHFWRRTRVALLPSLWWENQPLVAIEAMINGIPVIGSNRGGIPETLGGAGVCLPLPDRLTPATKIVPPPEEVEPWVQAVIRLWDDRAFYEEQSRLARQEALRWHPDRLRPLYAEFFGSIRRLAGPPFVNSE